MTTVRNYELTKELGSGSFGITYLGFNLSTQEQVAIKTIDIKKSTELGVNLTAINEEIDILRNLSDSKYVAKYYDSFEDYLDNKPTIFIVSEYIDGGDLFSFMETDGDFEPNILWPLYSQLLLGLKYIHDNGCAHRDIKPENILITKNYEIKYIDFGLSCLNKCKLDLCTDTCKDSQGGTLYYNPPEFYNNTAVASYEGAKAHDIWSLTMVLFELANGMQIYPFDMGDQDMEQLSTDQIIQKILDIPSYYLSNYRNDDDGRTNKFLDTLIVPDWRSRPTIGQVLYLYLDDIISKVW